MKNNKDTEVTKRKKNHPHSCIGKIHIIQRSILLKANCRIYWSQSNISKILFRLRKTMLKFIQKHKQHWIAKAILNNKNKATGNTRLHDILQGNYSRNSLVLAQKYTWRPWNRTETPEINLHKSTHLQPTYLWQMS